MVTAAATYVRFGVLLFPLLLIAPRPASAQFNSTIQGTFTDSQGAVIPGAVVRVTNATTGLARDAVTSPDGVYRVFSLAAGTYRVEVELSGFRTVRREAVNVGISETVRLDFALELSNVSETVTVAGTAPPVDTEQGRGTGRDARTRRT